ncbi:MAG: restriction endonuclease subunit R [Gammaproteobacteria bacterium]|nr:MAG: restriction endonuclease subunit R [Gammaproteobacteria bacterium]RKZ44154.1 MAG: restriction endonuclease subunit R [Gammaproteobacteria bacterium]RKZ75803.1 MAG: restriction endonuclease subunit R [Gammaproteobacteria bacterium]
MATNIQASNVTLNELKSKFNLELVRDNGNFFPEWQTDLPEITEVEKQVLDNVQTGYFNLIGYPSMLENIVQLSVLAPILQLAGFFLQPLWIKSEASVNILSEDKEVTIEGKIDVLVLKEQLWVLVIESKRAELSIKVGLAQILAYMLATPHKPCFGLITNGGSFVFLKLVMNGTPQYSMSRVFDLVNPGNDLYSVLGVLKKIRQLFFQS